MEKHALLRASGCPKYYIQRQFDGKFKEFESSRIITANEQRKKYKALLVDSTGWLTFVTSPNYLFNAGILASDIANNYLNNGLRVKWLNTFDVRRPEQQEEIIRSNLIVFDALFYDGHKMNRDTLYSTISRYCQSDDCSVLVIGQAPTPKLFINYLGLKPNYIFQVS